MKIDSLGNITAVNTWGLNGLVSRWTPLDELRYLRPDLQRPDDLC